MECIKLITKTETKKVKKALNWPPNCIFNIKVIPIYKIKLIT